MCALGVALLAAGLAHAVPGDRTLVLDEPVRELSSSWSARGVHHIAFTRTGRCPTVGVWRLTGQPQTLGPKACATHPFALTLRGDVQWATVQTGEHGRRVYEVWRAEKGFRSNRDPYSEPRRIIRRTAEKSQRAPIVMYDGFFWVDGRLPGLKGTFSAPPVRVVPGGNSVAVQQPRGEIEFYLGGDQPIGRAQYSRGEVKALKGDSQSSQFLILKGSLLEVLTNRGEVRYTVELPSASSYGDDRCYVPRCRMAELRLADFEWPYAVYVRGQAIHVVDVRSGKDLVVRRPTARPVHAQIEVTGLTYSYGNRVSYLGRVKIDDLFGR